VKAKRRFAPFTDAKIDDTCIKYIVRESRKECLRSRCSLAQKKRKITRIDFVILDILIASIARCL
jgi:hypothetical protein